MKPRNFLELTSQCLPDDLLPCELEKYIDKQLWEEDEERAVEKALMLHPRINWEAYLERYEDVKKNGIDPVVHFIRHGVYERRSLFSLNSLNADLSFQSLTKVSIIVPVYNNGNTIEKCLVSLLNQTLKEIEIIIVNDGSSDDTEQIVKKLKTGEERITLISLPINQGTHLARKEGVNAATGRFVIFVDGDDTLKPEAAELAFNQIIKGHDIVGFDVSIQDQSGKASQDMQKLEKYLNSLKTGSYTREQILNKAFKDKTIPWNLNFRIFHTPVVKVALKNLPDAVIRLGEDALEFLSIMDLSRDYYQINAPLYNYVKGGKSSSFGHEDMPYGDALFPFIDYALNNEHQDLVDAFKHHHLQTLFNILLGLDGPIQGQYFKTLCQDYGHLLVLKEIIIKYNDPSPTLTNLLSSIAATHSISNEPKKVGLFINHLDSQKDSYLISALIRTFEESRYELALFVEEKRDLDLQVFPAIPRYYIAIPYSANGRIRRLLDINEALIASGIDTILYIDCLNNQFFWDFLVFKSYGLNVLTWYPWDINFEILKRGRKFTHIMLNDTLALVDMVFCVNLSTELYFKSRQINALYLPQPVTRLPEIQPYSSRQNIVLTSARIGEGLYQLKLALQIINDILPYVPDVKLVIIGAYLTLKSRNAFLAHVDGLGLSNHVKIIDWQNDHTTYMASARLYLSTAFIEGYPHIMAECLANGIPAVMFDTDVTFATKNTGVITIPQQDTDLASAEVIRILTTTSYWNSLSLGARKDTPYITFKEFSNSVLNALACLHVSSAFVWRDYKLHKNILNFASKYAGKSLPVGF